MTASKFDKTVIRQGRLPKVIEKVGFDFHWDEEKVWALDVPVESMSMRELEWHFNLPFWGQKHAWYSLKPQQVLRNKSRYQTEYKRIMKTDLKYPIDIMFWKGRWLILDGLHRLAKARVIGLGEVRVRKIPKKFIPLIARHRL